MGPQPDAERRRAGAVGWPYRDPASIIPVAVFPARRRVDAATWGIPPPVAAEPATYGIQVDAGLSSPSPGGEGPPPGRFAAHHLHAVVTAYGVSASAATTAMRGTSVAGHAAPRRPVPD